MPSRPVVMFGSTGSNDATTSLRSQLSLRQSATLPPHINQGASLSSFIFFYFYLGVPFVLQGMHVEIQSEKTKAKKKTEKRKFKTKIVTDPAPFPPAPWKQNFLTTVSTYRLHRQAIQETSRHCKHAIIARPHRGSPTASSCAPDKKK